MKINFKYEISEEEALRILLETHHVELFEDPLFMVNEYGELAVYKNGKLFDDRGELYLALYHLATKIFINTEFRSRFENPNAEMAELYDKVNGYERKKKEKSCDLCCKHGLEFGDFLYQFSSSMENAHIYEPIAVQHCPKCGRKLEEK